MAIKTIQFERYQNKNGKSTANGKWYGRVVTTGTVDTKDLAKIIQDRATVRESDVIAVLNELGEAVGQFIGQGKRVHLDGIGFFKVGISTEGVTRRDDFNIGFHLKGININFQPETYKTANGTRSADWKEGIKFSENDDYSKNPQ